MFYIGLCVKFNTNVQLIRITTVTFLEVDVLSLFNNLKKKFSCEATLNNRRRALVRTWHIMTVRLRTRTTQSATCV
jgi:translation initiation factor 1 (eIF-1/SUI1)